MREPKVTLFVFNKNGKSLIKKCLDSLKSQSYKNFDIVFVDDGSSDGSVDFLRKRYKKIKVIQLTGVGIAAAQQKAYSSTKSKYIASLHIDAVPNKDWLKELVNTIESSGSDVACAQSIVHQGNSILDGSVNVLSSNIVNLYRDDEEKFYAGTAAMILRNGVTKLYCDPDYFFYLEDLYLGWVLRLLGFRTVRSFKSKVTHEGTHSQKSDKTRKKYQFLYERNRIINILIFYQNTTIMKIFPVFVFHIILKILYNLLKDQQRLEPHFRSYLWVLSNLGNIIEKRKIIQNLRLVDDNRITKYMSSKIVPENSSASKIINRIVELYFRLVNLKTIETR